MFLKISKVILAVVIIGLSLYSTVTQNFELMPYLMLCLSVFSLVVGLIELQKARKGYIGYIFMIASVCIMFTSIQGFLIS
ncbi:hypothetical protein ASG89_16735 [Paenibacillus sp. Soil766]|nr:hypothetical protein ASG89_16735 [Paenibacillus sp. Soil766]